jgi:hypothetical protein
METTGDRVLTAWAAGCAAHALARFPDVADPHALSAIAAARAWASGDGTLDACRDAAVEAQFAARELAESGYHAHADAVRSAGNAAASADDAGLAEVSADYAVEALARNSAACELPANVGSERHWPWTQLPESHRAALFGEEPAEPGPSACAL